MCTLAIACSAIIALGVDLDRPQEGVLTIATTPVAVVRLPLMLAAVGVLSLWRAGSRRD